MVPGQGDQNSLLQLNLMTNQRVTAVLIGSPSLLRLGKLELQPAHVLAMMRLAYLNTYRNSHFKAGQMPKK